MPFWLSADDILSLDEVAYVPGIPLVSRWPQKYVHYEDYSIAMSSGLAHERGKDGVVDLLQAQSWVLKPKYSFGHFLNNEKKKIANL